MAGAFPKNGDFYSVSPGLPVKPYVKVSPLTASAKVYVRSADIFDRDMRPSCYCCSAHVSCVCGTTVGIILYFVWENGGPTRPRASTSPSKLDRRREHKSTLAIVWMAEGAILRLLCY